MVKRATFDSLILYFQVHSEESKAALIVVMLDCFDYSHPCL
jgi:hypothetical protein